MSKLDTFLRDFEQYTQLYDRKEDPQEHDLTLRLREIGSEVRLGNTSWTMLDLKAIVEWKRLKRVNPRIKNETRNPPADVERLLKFAFTVQDERLKIEVLDLIHGVGPALVSAILTFTNPEHYGVIDYHAWNALRSFNQDLLRKGLARKRFRFKKHGSFTASELLDYLDVIRGIAQRRNTSARNVDKALFTYDKVNRTKEWTLAELSHVPMVDSKKNVLSS